LQFPEVVSVPPVATIYGLVSATDCKPSSVINQPLVESMKINVIAIPSVDIIALLVEPPILSEPF
jgi:hypothetical protein